MRSARSVGATPVTLYLTTENVDKVVAKAVKLGAKLVGPVTDQFWGDRTGTIVDPEGNTWMIGTHVAEPTPQEMKKRMAELMKAQAATSRD
jgi:PhnB protein